MTFQNRLLSDRFQHTIKPGIIWYGHSQVELLTIFRPEIYDGTDWIQDNESSAYSIYENLKIRHSFFKHLEFHLSYTDLIIKADDKIRQAGRDNLNTGLSLGAKYQLPLSLSHFIQMGIFAELTVPKPENIVKTYLSPEIRLLLSHPFWRHLDISYNAGTAYSNYSRQMILLYAIQMKYNAGKRTIFFAEFYRNFTKTGPPRVANKRVVLGSGFYLLEDLFFYVSLETGWDHEDPLNDGRLDIGMTWRFPRVNQP